MDISILYLQANEEVARTIKDKFERENVEFLVTQTAEQAFAIYKERDIFLTLVDSYIKDMRLKDFVSRCSREYPQMLLNICMDISDPDYIPTIVSEPSVRKVFLPPWNIEDIVDGLAASLDEAYIRHDLYVRKQEFEAEEEGFNNTLKKLKEALVRQQYSYNKLEPFFAKLLNNYLARNDVDKTTTEYLRMSCELMLRLQTTTALRVADIEELIRNSILKMSPGVRIDKVENCIMGGVARSCMADIIFLVTIIVKLETYRRSNVSVSIDSRYVSSTNCEYTVVVKGNKESEISEQAVSFVKGVLATMTAESSINDGDDELSVVMRIETE